MSTQKRVDRSTPATGICRRGTWSWQRISSMKRAGARSFPSPAYLARHVCAVANGRTASLLPILWSALAWMATKFLQSDHHIGQLVRPVLIAGRRGSPPDSGGCRAPLGTQATPRSSIPHIPYPSGLARLHLPLPQFPAGFYRRAERYDGKRDLYFQHAA